MPELSVIVPAARTNGSLRSLVEHMHESLAGVDWELVVVNDDSSESTLKVSQDLAQSDKHVRSLWRVGRNGLSGAISEGICSSSAPFVAVMSEGHRHNDRALPTMLARIKSDGLDIVVANPLAGVATAQNATLAQRVALWLGSPVIRAKLSNPTSGFFVMRRDAFEGAVRRLSDIGSGFLLDLFASSQKPLRYVELPVSERRNAPSNEQGRSGFAWEILTLTLDKTIGRLLPTRFILFGLVGGFGVFVHLFTLWCGLTLLRLGFIAAQTLATVVAMTSNFYLNNILTFRDQRLQGTQAFRGLISFYAVCGVGVIGNVGVANFFYQQDQVWWIAGAAGTIVGAVWNFAASSVFTWQRKPR